MGWSKIAALFPHFILDMTDCSTENLYFRLSSVQKLDVQEVGGLVSSSEALSL